MKVLALSTYPTQQPEHGGQHRAHNIVLALRAAGYQVEVAGVLGSGGFAPSPGFQPYPSQARLTHQTGESPQLEELTIGDLFAQEDSYFNALADSIAIQPDLTVVEQPWMMRFARRYRRERLANAGMILYSSHNIESEMKFEIIRADRGLAAAEAARRKILACEIEAIQGADAVTCVSASDLAWTRRHTQCRTALAPNGVQARSSSAEGLAQAQAWTHGRRFALYCGSAHPPNMNGFFEMMGPQIGCIAPDQHIVIAGGAGPAIVDDARFAGVGGLARMCVAAGSVSEPCLQGLLATAQVIMLPITQGGGTNLKTAEALWSGRHIVATSMAMRGFEAFMDAPGVQIANSVPTFLTALRLAMAAPSLVLSATEQDRRRSVLWDAALQPLTALASQLQTLMHEAAHA